MNSYFFKMNKQEKENILDQHKSLYDGYVTHESKNNNQSPLYVQDFANDKNGITVSNKGVVKNYTNMNINENLLDMIGDGPKDLKNGTVDFDSVPEMMGINTKMMHDKYPSPNEDEEEYMSAGKSFDSDFSDESSDFPLDDYEYDIDELEDYSVGDDYDESYNSNEMEEEELTYGEKLEDSLEQIDEDKVSDVVYQLYESINMFHRMKKYN